MRDRVPQPQAPQARAPQVRAPQVRAAQVPPIAPAGGIDPRGPRFAAGVTSVVLAVAVLTDNRWVLAFQAAVFALGAGLGVGRSPYGWLYRRIVRPRLGPPDDTEDPAPPRFAQTVGLAVTGVGLACALLGVPHAVEVGAGLAFVAAFLNASTGFCLGCRIHVLLVRARTAR